MLSARVIIQQQHLQQLLSNQWHFPTQLVRPWPHHAEPPSLPSQRATVPLLITTSDDPAPLCADTGPCGTPAGADGEVNQIMCPTQITGGLQLTRLRASNGRKSWSKMIYIRAFTSRLHKSRRYYKTLPKNGIHLVFLYMWYARRYFPLSLHVFRKITHTWPVESLPPGQLSSRKWETSNLQSKQTHSRVRKMEETLRKTTWRIQNGCHPNRNKAHKFRKSERDTRIN